MPDLSVGPVADTCTRSAYRKILVTGGSGLVGAGLKRIRADYPDRQFILANSKQCDLTRVEDTLDFVGRHKPDAILHLAALSGGVELNIKHPASLLRDNVFMNMNVLEAARTNRVKKIVMTLSSGMYPANAPNPLLESYIHDGPPHESDYAYAFAKRLVEPAIRAYRKEYGLNVIGLIPNGTFGENGNFSHGKSAVWAALVRRFYENRDNEQELVVWGDGSTLREYTYAQDIARAFMWCLDNYDGPQVLNVGSTEEHSVKEIAYMIAEELGIDSRRIKFDASKPQGIFQKSFDNSRFLQLSEFKFTPFRAGLQRTIRWFCENYGVPGSVRL
jgi:GDP-L-fucose synthase